MINSNEIDSLPLTMYPKPRPLPEYSNIPTYETEDEDRYEKPWQRALFAIARKGLHLYEPVTSVPSIFILVLLGFYLLLGYLTQLVEDDMPRIVTEAEVPGNSWNQFSEESALQYLHQIIGDEPRVAGTKYHLQKTQDLLATLNSIASQAKDPVKTDWQVVSGDFWLNFTTPFVSHYQRLSNVMAVLEGQSGFNLDGSTRASLLLNCHYDSVPFALGASDNAVFCAVLAECLKRLSRRGRKFKQNIVFLFNGAEENPLQASHAFLQHPWAKGVNAVINLDAAGMNGKPAVFQVTDPRILKAYRKGARRPNAQGVGEFIFSSGLVPSDTDFRVFRDYGHIQGIDIAFTKWGHVYHTRYDHPSLIKPGVIQNAGDTVLATIAEAADMDLERKVKAATVVYADFLNLFLVTCSQRTALVADVGVGVFGLITVAYYIWMVGLRWSSVRELLLWAVAGRVLSALVGAMLVLVIAICGVSAGMQLRYLSQPWLVVAMYWIPYLVGAVATGHWCDSVRTKKSGLNRSIRCVQAMAATRLVLSLVLLVMCLFPSVSSLRYIISTSLCLASLAATVSLTLIRYVKLNGWQHLTLETLLAVPASLFVLSLALRLDALMLPVMGRGGSARPDYPVAYLNLAMAALAGLASSGIELLFSRRRLWVWLSLLLGTSVILTFVPFSPYQDEGPSTQRHYWFHTEIVSYNEAKVPIERTAGVLITKQDTYSIASAAEAFKKAGLQYNVRTDFKDDCDTKVHCGLPVYRVAFGKNLRDAMFLYTGPPKPFLPAPGIEATRSCDGLVCTYDFNVTVAPHNLVSLWPRANVSVTGWSFESSPRASFELQSRPVFVVMHSTATYSDVATPMTFKVTVQVTGEFPSGPLLDVSLHSHKMQHPEEFTGEYQQLLAAAPKYFNVATFLSYRYNYMF